MFLVSVAPLPPGPFVVVFLAGDSGNICGLRAVPGLSGGPHLGAVLRSTWQAGPARFPPPHRHFAGHHPRDGRRQVSKDLCHQIAHRRLAKDSGGSSPSALLPRHQLLQTERIG